AAFPVAPGSRPACGGFGPRALLGLTSKSATSTATASPTSPAECWKPVNGGPDSRPVLLSTPAYGRRGTLASPGWMFKSATSTATANQTSPAGRWKQGSGGQGSPPPLPS